MKKLLSTFLIAVAFMACGICMTACNELPKHTITFIDGDTTYSTIETAGLESITLPTEPTKENYTFAGWYFDNNTWQNELTNDYYKDKTLESDVNVYAKWDIPTSYYIDYILNGGTNNVNNPSTYTIKTETITLLAPSKDGYTFDGWFDNSRFSGNAITEIAKGSSGNKTLYAKWTINTYTITYTLNGGTNNVNNPENYTVEDNITLLTPSKIGYTFAGWFNNSTFSGSAVTAIPQGSTGDITLYVKWTINTYTISYVMNDGTNNIGNPDTYTVETETITLLTPTKTGYTFSGWYNNSTFSGDAINSIPQGSANNITLYAKWTVDNYSITYNLNGGTNNTDNPATFNIESDDITLKEPTRNGYTFEGWFESENFSGDAVTKIAQGTLKNITLYAKWKIVTYSIDYIVFLGTNNENNPATYTVETATITLLVPSKDGYTFGGWFDNLGFSGDAITTIPKGSFGNKTLYAKWTIINYAITYELDGGTNNPDNPETYTIIDNITLLEPTKSMYEFLGWFIGDEEITTLSGGLFENITITAHWQNIFIMDEVEPTKLIGFTSYGKTISEIIVANNVKTIEAEAFKDCEMTKVTVPSTVQEISEAAFRGVKNLKEMTLPFVGPQIKTNEELYQYPFGYIFGTVSYTGSTAIQQEYYSTDLDHYEHTTYFIPSTLQKVAITGGNILFGAFYGCSMLTNISLPSGLTVIEHDAFNKCKNLTSILIPKTVTHIAHDAFYECENLETCTFEEDSQLTIIGLSAFFFCKKLASIVVPDSVVSIIDGAFAGCNNLEEMTLPFAGTSDGVGTFDSLFFSANNKPEKLKVVNITKATTITENCFKDFTSLTTVTLPDTVQNIGSSAFSGCSNLAIMTIPANITKIEDATFKDCSSLTLLTIPAGVTSIGSSAFEGCIHLYEVYNLSSLPITKGGTDYGYVGYYAKIIHQNIQEESIIKIIDGGLWCIDESDFIFVKALNYNCTTFTLDSRTTKIDAYAFYGCAQLASIILPDEITNIGDFAFYGCLSLASINIPEKVTNIGDFAFYNCSTLASINIPEKVTNIGKSAFNGCAKLTSITLPAGITCIKDSAFRNCSALISINIPDKVECIKFSAFSDCSSLTSIIIPDEVTSIEQNAFYLCTALETVTIDSETIASDLNTASSKGSLIHYATIVKIREDITTIGTYVTNTENFTYTSTIEGYKVYTKVS